jgi:gluconokinase
MPASLLPSQRATLEPLADDEPGVVVSPEGDPDDVLAEALEALGLSEGESR